MRKLLQNESGTGGIEFAFIAPLLSLLLLGIGSGWSFLQQDSGMRDTVEVAAKYYIQGGTSDSAALSIANAAWVNKPADGSVSVNRTCVCAGALVNCGAGVVCGDASVPQIHLTITSTSTWRDDYVNNIYPCHLDLVESEVVRVR